jgi:predicted ferric reductase
MPFPDEAFIPKPLWRKNHYRYHKWTSIISIFSLGLHAYLPPGGGDCGVEKVDVLVAGVVGDVTVPLWAHIFGIIVLSISVIDSAVV